MRKIFFALLMILAFAGTSLAASNVTFQWTANIEPDLAGYRLYQSASSGIYVYGEGNEVIDIPVGTAIGTAQVQDGTWFWVLRAYDTAGNESGDSNEVTKALNSVGPADPAGLTITIIIKVEQ